MNWAYADFDSLPLFCWNIELKCSKNIYNLIFKKSSYVNLDYKYLDRVFVNMQLLKKINKGRIFCWPIIHATPFNSSSAFQAPQTAVFL